MFRFIHALIKDFSDLLFPDSCLGCTQSLSPHEYLLCTTCRMNLPETNNHQEPYDFTLLNKFAGKIPVTFLASFVYFKKGGIVQKIIHNFKYKGYKEAARELALWYGNQLKIESQQLSGIDVIIGVPLHRSRLLQRGYNQADWIADGLSEALNVPARTDILVRNQFRSSQTRMNRLERWQNVNTVFSVTDPNAVLNKNILLVDDVLTTGATIEACAVELLKAGCKSISVITLAVAEA